MKVLYFNYRDKRKKMSERKQFNLEKYLFNSFLAVFIILLGVQAVLINPSFRTALTVDQGLEGSPLGSEEYLYNTGTMELRLEDSQSSDVVKVLVNGEERAAFESAGLIIGVNEGDVVEIDASEARGDVRVTISALSGNFDQECLGKSYEVKGGVQKLLKVRNASH